MAKLNIAPTKSNLLNLRRDLDMATQGFELLDQKREILVMELMRLLDRVRETRKELDRAREQAYSTLRKAIVRHGPHTLRRTASSISYPHKVEISQHILAGVRVPEITVEFGKFRSQFGFAHSDSLTDQVMQTFLEFLRVAGQMAELETRVWLLARELKKTQRRVNALEQIFIPDFKETMHYIQESIESKELQEIFIQKMVKKRASTEPKLRDAGTKEAQS